MADSVSREAGTYSTHFFSLGPGHVILFESFAFVSYEEISYSGIVGLVISFLVHTGIFILEGIFQQESYV